MFYKILKHKHNTTPSEKANEVVVTFQRQPLHYFYEGIPRDTLISDWKMSPFSWTN